MSAARFASVEWVTIDGLPGAVGRVVRLGENTMRGQILLFVYSDTSGSEDSYLGSDWYAPEMLSEVTP